MLKTIVSYPDRGKYGKNSWRGNCSGLLIKDLLEFFNPRRFFDPMVGSGTTHDVCKELGIEHVCVDLNPEWGGWDALSDEVPIFSDFIFFHPPYHNIIKYSGNMWGKEADPRDLSRCLTYEDFIQKLNKVQAKLISSLRKKGHIAILVGDVKKNGRLFSIQKDMDWYGSPEQVIIKAQHNCFSNNISYSGKFIPIVHEYLLIFKRDDCYIIPCRVIKQINVDLRRRANQTWRDVVKDALEAIGGKAKTEQLYEELADHAKSKANPHWREKIRQTLQRYDKDFEHVAEGVWSLYNPNTKKSKVA